jgi:hypothetical protein
MSVPLFTVAQVQAALPNLVNLTGNTLEAALRTVSILAQSTDGADRQLSIQRYKEEQTALRGIFRTRYAPIVVTQSRPILLESKEDYRLLPFGRRRFAPYGRYPVRPAWTTIPNSTLLIDNELGHVEFEGFCRIPQLCRLTYYSGYDLSDLNDPDVATMFQLVLAMLQAIDANGGQIGRGAPKAIEFVDEYVEEYYQPDMSLNPSPLAFGLEGFKHFRARSLKA